MSTEVSNPAESDNKLTKRVAQLFEVAAIPATLTAAVGDFLGQKGGWLVVGGLGFLALLAAVYLLMSLSLVKTGKTPFWYRVTNGDKELSWIWSTNPPISSHGVHVVAVFGFICLFCAGKTYASLDSGGFLGKNFDVVAAAQKQLGLTQELVESQKKTNQELSKLNQSAANFKKEVSDDPRKELANLQIPWTSEGLIKSIRNNDSHAVQLFVASNFNYDESNFDVDQSLALSMNEDIQALLTNFGVALTAQECTRLIGSHFKVLGERVATSHPKTLLPLLQKKCKTEEFAAFIKSKTSGARESYDKEMNEYKEGEAGKAAMIEARRKERQRCIEIEGPRGPGRADTCERLYRDLEFTVNYPKPDKEKIIDSVESDSRYLKLLDGHYIPLETRSRVDH